MVRYYQFEVQPERTILRDLYIDLPVIRGTSGSKEFANLIAIVDEIQPLKITENSPDVVIETFQSNPLEDQRYLGYINIFKGNNIAKQEIILELTCPQYRVYCFGNYVEEKVLGGRAIVDSTLAKKYDIKEKNCISVKVYGPVPQQTRGFLEDII